jgi:hypothetical protein
MEVNCIIKRYPEVAKTASELNGAGILPALVYKCEGSTLGSHNANPAVVFLQLAEICCPPNLTVLD